MPPYSISSPVIETVLASLTPGARAEVARHCDFIRSERERLSAELAKLDGITEVLPSDANFLLVKAKDADRCMQLAEQGGVLIRNFGWQLPGCLRITVGNTEENDRLLESLAELCVLTNASLSLTATAQ